MRDRPVGVSKRRKLWELSRRGSVQFTDRQDDSCGLSSAFLLAAATKAAFTHGVICKTVCHDDDVFTGLTVYNLGSVHPPFPIFLLDRPRLADHIVCVLHGHFVTTWLAS